MVGERETIAITNCGVRGSNTVHHIRLQYAHAQGRIRCFGTYRGRGSVGQMLNEK